MPNGISEDEEMLAVYPCVYSRTFTVLLPDPTRLFLISSFVPLIVETIEMIAAIPIMIPSMVRKERILCDQMP